MIARKVAPDRVISTVDTQAWYTRKSKSQRRDGYRAASVLSPPVAIVISTSVISPDVGVRSLHVRAVGVKWPGRDRCYHTTKPTPATIKPAAEPGEPVVASTSVDTIDTDFTHDKADA